MCYYSLFEEEKLPTSSLNGRIITHLIFASLSLLIILALLDLLLFFELLHPFQARP